MKQEMINELRRLSVEQCYICGQLLNVWVKEEYNGEQVRICQHHRKPTTRKGI